MVTRSSETKTASDQELVITRVFDAPRELVFKAWTEPERVMQWLGPKDFTSIEFRMDNRPGGKWQGRMRGPDGTEYSNHGTVRSFVEPEQIAFSFAWSENPGDENEITITFAEVDGKTEMTFRQGPFPTMESRDGHSGGWNQSFDKLAEYLGGVA
jgi:uncharacterized protein YndB with AHSA1/START domain